MFIHMEAKRYFRNCLQFVTVVFGHQLFSNNDPFGQIWRHFDGCGWSERATGVLLNNEWDHMTQRGLIISNSQNCAELENPCSKRKCGI